MAAGRASGVGGAWQCHTVKSLHELDTANWWAINSVARVLPSHGKSHWFESSIAHQLANAFTRWNVFATKKRDSMSVFFVGYGGSLAVQIQYRPAKKQRLKY